MEAETMKGLFKFIFGTIEAIIITAVIFAVSLVIGRAVTGSWDIREWKTSGAEAAAIVEYVPERE